MDSSVCRVARDELTRGRDAAIRFRDSNSSREDAKSEIDAIEKSFSTVLSLVTSASHSSEKASHVNKGKKARVERNKRTLQTPETFADGCAWRKYGKKFIRGYEHGRSYYRCTYKNEQNCQAKKYIQKLNGDSPMYLTTYFDNHSCIQYRGQDPQPPSQEMCEGSSSKIFSFQGTNDYEELSPVMDAVPFPNSVSCDPSCDYAAWASSTTSENDECGHWVQTFNNYDCPQLTENLNY